MHGSATVRRSKHGGAGRAPRHDLVVLCRGLEQLRVYESEYERRCMVEYEYAMYDLYHPDLSCL